MVPSLHSTQNICAQGRVPFQYLKQTRLKDTLEVKLTAAVGKEKMAGAVAYENLNFSLSKEKLAAVLDGEDCCIG